MLPSTGDVLLTPLARSQAPSTIIVCPGYDSFYFAPVIIGRDCSQPYRSLSEIHRQSRDCRSFRGPLSISIYSKNVLSAESLINEVFQPNNPANPSNWQPFFHFGSAKVTEGVVLCNPDPKLFPEIMS